MPWWAWLLVGIFSGGLGFYVWLIWYFSRDGGIFR